MSSYPGDERAAWELSAKHEAQRREAAESRVSAPPPRIEEIRELIALLNARVGIVEGVTNRGLMREASESLSYLLSLLSTQGERILSVQEDLRRRDETITLLMGRVEDLTQERDHWKRVDEDREPAFQRVIEQRNDLLRKARETQG